MSNLEPDRYLVTTKTPGYDLIADFRCEKNLDLKYLDDVELAKIKRALVRRFEYKQEIEALQEVAILQELKDSSVMFKICNFMKEKGREVRFAGFENWKNWIVEINGVNITSPLPRHTIVLGGQEEEYVRMYAASGRSDIGKVRLVIN